VSRIGDVHNLPIEARPDADVKRERPWLLLHTPRTESPSWAFAYGSTQTTEIALGATPLALAWTRARTGRVERSNFFPARLRTPPADDVGCRIGGAAGGARIRAAFRSALGIGTGAGKRLAMNAPERGRVVRLTRAAELDLDGARFAVLLTPDGYARERRYQHLVPIYDSDEVEPQDGEIESDAAWVGALPGTMRRAILSIPALFTGSEQRRPFSPGHIIALTTVTLDPATLRHVDDALVDAFGL
jgi:hypothetical protein